MIVHAVDAHVTAQGSAYQSAYYGSQQAVAAAAPPTRIASTAPVPIPGPLALSRHYRAPCSIQRGYADTSGWGGVIAECDGSMVSVGGRMAAAPLDGGDYRGAARRVLLGSLDADVPGSNRLVLPSALMLLLAALALYFVARSFKEEPYRG